MVLPTTYSNLYRQQSLSTSQTMLLLLILCAIIVGGLGAQLPPGIKLCHRSDPNFPQCVAKNIGEALPLLADGNKELGIPILEPLYVPQLEIKGDPTLSVRLEQRYRNVRLHGLTASDLTKGFEVDLDNDCKWSADALSPYVRMEADYEIKGHLLLFPIDSHGKCNVTHHNLLNVHKMTCEKYTKKNNTYLRLTNYTMNMKPEKVVYEFDNIFPTSEQISNEILKTINENSLAIFNDVKAGYEEVFSYMYLNTANSVFSKIPLNKIFLD